MVPVLLAVRVYNDQEQGAFKLVPWGKGRNSWPRPCQVSIKSASSRFPLPPTPHPILWTGCETPTNLVLTASWRPNSNNPREGTSWHCTATQDVNKELLHEARGHKVEGAIPPSHPSQSSNDDRDLAGTDVKSATPGIHQPQTRHYPEARPCVSRWARWQDGGVWGWDERGMRKRRQDSTGGTLPNVSGTLHCRVVLAHDIDAHLPYERACNGAREVEEDLELFPRRQCHELVQPFACLASTRHKPITNVESDTTSRVKSALFLDCQADKDYLADTKHGRTTPTFPADHGNSLHVYTWVTLDKTFGSSFLRTR